jgi:hypothetical protein
MADSSERNRPLLCLNYGRGAAIRTRDLLNPIQVRYRAALRPADILCNYIKVAANAQTTPPAQKARRPAALASGLLCRVLTSGEQCAIGLAGHRGSGLRNVYAFVGEGADANVRHILQEPLLHLDLVLHVRLGHSGRLLVT